jgi:hypothetical protein
VSRRRARRAAAVAVTLAAAFPATADSATRWAIHVTVHEAPKSNGALIHTGTFVGPPLGRGTVRTRTRIGVGRGALITFALTTKRGTVRGTGDCKVTFKGARVYYLGTAKVTSGTGAYRMLRARGLQVSGSGELRGRTFAVKLTGRS